jgi:hypothetical protein
MEGRLHHPLVLPLRANWDAFPDVERRGYVVKDAFGA